MQTLQLTKQEVDDVTDWFWPVVEVGRLHYADTYESLGYRSA